MKATVYHGAHDVRLENVPDPSIVDPSDAIVRITRAAVTLCDVMGTGHYGVVAAQTTPGSTVVIVRDGAVGLCAALSAAKIVHAERIVAVGHNSKRLEIAKCLGATHTFNSHNPTVREQIIELTSGGAQHVVEAVGNQESMILPSRWPGQGAR